MIKKKKRKKKLEEVEMLIMFPDEVKLLKPVLFTSDELDEVENHISQQLPPRHNEDKS